MTECPFRCVVQMVRDGDVWRLAVKNRLFIHNHEMIPDMLCTYSASRGARHPEVAKHVDGMVSTGAKRSKIYYYLLEKGENVVQRNVDNIVQVHRSSVATKDDNDETAAILSKFASAHLENVVTVDVSASDEAAVISLTSRHMRATYCRFCELLLVDCTHKTNRSVCAPDASRIRP